MGCLPAPAVCSWAARLGGPGHANAVWVACESGCRWSFDPLAFDSFLYFLIIFKSLQIQKFVHDSFQLRNYEKKFVG
jgi:hypothetical protein